MYGTLETIKTRLSEQMLLTLAGSAQFPGLLDDAVIDRVINESDGLINFHVRGRYPLPLPEPHPPELIGWWGDLAVMALYKGRPEVGDPPVSVVSADKEARRILAKIQDGTAELYDKTDAASPAVPESSRIIASTPPRQFGGPGGMLEKF